MNVLTDVNPVPGYHRDYHYSWGHGMGQGMPFVQGMPASQGVYGGHGFQEAQENQGTGKTQNQHNNWEEWGGVGVQMAGGMGNGVLRAQGTPSIQGALTQQNQQLNPSPRQNSPRGRSRTKRQTTNA